MGVAVTEQSVTEEPPALEAMIGPQVERVGASVAARAPMSLDLPCAGLAEVHSGSGHLSRTLGLLVLGYLGARLRVGLCLLKVLLPKTAPAPLPLPRRARRPGPR